MNNDSPEKDAAAPHEFSACARSLAPVRTVLKRKSDEEISRQRGHVTKKEKIETMHIGEEENVNILIEPDSDCESNYKDLEAKTQALLNDVRSRKRSTQPRVQKKPKAWCCQCEALQEFINLRCQCGHVTSACRLCEQFD